MVLGVLWRYTGDVKKQCTRVQKGRQAETKVAWSLQSPQTLEEGAKLDIKSENRHCAEEHCQSIQTDSVFCFSSLWLYSSCFRWLHHSSQWPHSRRIQCSSWWSPSRPATLSAVNCSPLSRWWQLWWWCTTNSCMCTIMYMLWIYSCSFAFPVSQVSMGWVKALMLHSGLPFEHFKKIRYYQILTTSSCQLHDQFDAFKKTNISASHSMIPLCSLLVFYCSSVCPHNLGSFLDWKIWQALLGTPHVWCWQINHVGTWYEREVQCWWW